ncbi:DUF6503 family protein [Aureivirga sp. CE67]|uniref:DUF6503 family protein n=1 Tax=Aureivirga sp. CE67 TaxID=1788983 RepID=UPI0018CB262F|nr:DUF6503 family protein [Aureivirga sp. CE67]
MRKYVIILGLIAIFSVSCKQKKLTKVEEIIETTLKKAGSEFLEDVTVTFDFDDDKIEVYKKYGDFKYTRTFQDTLGNIIIDEATNNGFTRLKNGEVEQLPEEMEKKYKMKLYYDVFEGLVPFRLMQPIKSKELIGTVDVKFEEYYKVKVEFENNYPSEVIYWIQTDDFTIDYIGFISHDGETPVLRVAIDETKISGIWFSDFIRYYSEKPVPIDSLDQLYNDQILKEDDLIEVDDVIIKSNPI